MMRSLRLCSGRTNLTQTLRGCQGPTSRLPWRVIPIVEVTQRNRCSQLYVGVQIENSTAIDRNPRTNLDRPSQLLKNPIKHNSGRRTNSEIRGFVWRNSLNGEMMLPKVEIYLTSSIGEHFSTCWSPIWLFGRGAAKLCPIAGCAHLYDRPHHGCGG